MKEYLEILISPKKHSSKWLFGISIVVLLVTLYFGLRPKDFSYANNVRWVVNDSGIVFDKYGIAYTDPIDELSQEIGFAENGFSIEIAFKPLDYEEGFGFIFALHNGDDRKQLMLGQWRSWFIAMNGDDYDHKKRVKRISVNVDSRSTVTQFLTITTNKAGTNIYLNGQLVKSEEDLTLQIPYGDSARIFLGNSPYGKHSWRGAICGLAFFRYTLTAQDAGLHFKRWSQDRIFSFAGNGNPFLLYNFAEKGGARIPDHAGSNHHLNIPRSFPILKKKILSSPMNSFVFDKRGIEDLFINIIGFIPLGFIFSLTLSGFGSAFKKRLVCITLILCVLVSLVIEITQAWIPSRDSSQMDLICNTLGSMMGAAVFYLMAKFGIRFIQY